MTQAKHTKGRWRVSKRNPTRIVSCNENLMAHTTEFGTHPDNYTPEQCERARLIAAAPDLLEALEAFVAKIDPAIYVEKDLAMSPLVNELRQAEAAIAKATG